MSDTPETDAAVNASGGDWSPVLRAVAQRLERERDEAREALKHIDEYGTEEINAAVELRQKLAQALVERDEAREELAKITKAAEAVIDRWEQPAWKDTEPTGAVIYRLRDALGREAK